MSDARLPNVTCPTGDLQPHTNSPRPLRFSAPSAVPFCLRFVGALCDSASALGVFLLQIVGSSVPVQGLRTAMSCNTLALAPRSRISSTVLHSRPTWVCSTCRQSRRRAYHGSSVPHNQSLASKSRAQAWMRTKPPGFQKLGYATMAEYRDGQWKESLTMGHKLTCPDQYTTKGPMAEYDARVEAGTLRNDEHQRSEHTPRGSIAI